MKNRLIIFLALGMAIVPESVGETVDLKPGSLPGMVKKLESSLPSELRLSGEATAIDLISLKDIPSSVVSLDMSDLMINGIKLENSRYMGQTEFSDGELPPYALFSTNVKEVRLPSSLKVIGEGAFAETPLESVVFPSTLESIGSRAFYQCRLLESVDISASAVSSLPEQCFYGCEALRDISFPRSLVSIGDRAMMKSGVKSVDIPNVSDVGEYAFAEMPFLTDVTVRDGARFGEGAFFGDGLLERMTGVPSNSAALAMANSGIHSIFGYIEGEVIEDGAYANLNVDTIVIHPSVKEIRSHAFRNARNLKAVDVSGLGKNIPITAADAFAGTDVSNVSLVMAKDDEPEWREAPVWRDFRIGAAVSGIGSAPEERVVMSVVRSGDEVEISANRKIEEVTVYSLSGMMLHQSRPGETVCVTGPFAEKELVVKVSAGGVMKIVKILR